MEVSSNLSSKTDSDSYAEVNDVITQISSKVQIQDITTELHCPLCNDWFCDPLMLSCGHNFCQSCIQNFWKQQANETFCPECKMLCQYSNCTFNLVLEKLVEKIKKLPLLKGHPRCPEHGENLKLFSKPDGRLICFQCKDARLSVGQSKEFLQISDAVRFFTEELTIHQGQLEATRKELLSLKNMQKDAIAAHKDIIPLLDSLEQGMRVLTPKELVSRKLSPGVFKGPIQYMMWRDMQSTLSPVAEGGTISDPRAADFLFSCDASHPDTLRIYQSLDYIEDNATVFHAFYLSAVANAEIKNSVALGHFILPPASLQKEIRRKIGSFIWEQDQHFLIEKQDEVTSNELKAFRESSVLATDHKKDLSRSTEKHCIRTPVVEKQMYFPLQHYPVNNMVTGYISIDAMKKFLGELHDFIPGSSGYLAYHVQNEINMSAIKNKLKNKY